MIGIVETHGRASLRPRVSTAVRLYGRASLRPRVSTASRLYENEK
ncbi:MAG: hypothetical protein VSS75_009670 [Candidatus Parabeggiatoa sp.]|nr:hypothetical protein [Candidatus Parabeggiatoa sp.]